MDNMERVEINGLDIFDLMNLINRRKRRYLAILLSELEEIVGDDPEMQEKYTYIRKAVLDHFNEYTRSLLRMVLGGDIEGVIGY